MNSFLKNLAVLMFSIFLLTVTRSDAEENLKNTLEQAWDVHIAAYKSGNENAIKESMSSVAFGTMMNNLRDAKKELTQELMSIFAKNAPDVSQMRFVKILEKGPTAALIYTKEFEFPEGSKKQLISFAYIKFVKEKSSWKVDFVFTYGCDKKRIDGKECTLDLNDLPLEAVIDGKVPEAPVARTTPFAVGYLDVRADGYKTSININGLQQYNRTAGGSKLIAGGLRKGKNTISILIEKSDKAPVFEPRIVISRLVGEKDLVEMFKYEPKDNIEGEHTLTFNLEE